MTLYSLEYADVSLRIYSLSLTRLKYTSRLLRLFSIPLMLREYALLWLR